MTNSLSTTFTHRSRTSFGAEAEEEDMVEAEEIEEMEEIGGVNNNSNSADVVPKSRTRGSELSNKVLSGV